MLAAARALGPAETLSETARGRTLAAALRELRREDVAPGPDAGTRDGGDELAPHTAQVTTNDGLKVVMADVEPISEERAAAAAKLAAGLIARAVAAKDSR